MVRPPRSLSGGSEPSHGLGPVRAPVPVSTEVTATATGLALPRREERPSLPETLARVEAEEELNEGEETGAYADSVDDMDRFASFLSEEVSELPPEELASVLGLVEQLEDAERRDRLAREREDERVALALQAQLESEQALVPGTRSTLEEDAALARSLQAQLAKEEAAAEMASMPTTADDAALALSLQTTLSEHFYENREQRARREAEDARVAAALQRQFESFDRASTTGLSAQLKSQEAADARLAEELQRQFDRAPRPTPTTAAGPQLRGPPVPLQSSGAGAGETIEEIVAVPQCYVGLLLGRGKVALRDLTEATGVSIAYPPRSRDPVSFFAISGPTAGVRQAKARIESAIARWVDHS